MDLEKNPIEYPTDIKLLLCQLVHDSKESDSWNDIIDKLNNHPILTQLHQVDIESLGIDSENISVIIVTVIKDTLTRFDGKPSTPKRGRPPSKNKLSSSSVSKDVPDIDTTQSSNIKYFQPGNKSIGSECLTRCCSILHHKRVQEIKDQLAQNKQLFATILQKQVALK